ncbi:amidohydrolase [Clostridiales bacterium PH28_bin88]|nr:amidohydrolase [Clostridiales bacterium PH28_bin88]
MLAIINGTVITMAGNNYPRGIVLIDGGKIVAVGAGLPLPPGTQYLDAAGKVVMPGLIDAHCHVGIAEEIYRVEGDDTNEHTDPVTPHLRALDAVNPMDEGFRDALRGGVTAVGTGPGSANVIGGEHVVIKTYGQVVDRMVLRQPAGMKVAFGENPKRVYGEQKKMPATRMGTAGLLREQLVRAQSYRDKLVRGAKDPDKLPERDLKLEGLVKLLNREMPMRAHAHRADDIITAIRIAEEFGIDLVIEHCTEGHLIVDELARRRVPCIVGPTITARAKVELKERTFRTPGVLAAAAIPVALMTDHPVIPLEYLSLCAALAVKEGMTEDAALRAITIDAARILGVDDRVGSLAPGKDADVLILSGPVLDVRSRVETVLINGQVAYRNE